MKRVISQMLILLGISVILGLGSNAVNPHGIPLIGQYEPIDYGEDGTIVPPSAMEGDPPFVSLKEAYGMYHDPSTIFLDAREPEDYELGHIKGAINLPFDWFDDYWPDVEPLLPKDAPIVVYCSGAECESSLYEGRYLSEIGYTNIHVFFGGWSEWVQHDFPTEKGDDSGA